MQQLKRKLIYTEQKIKANKRQLKEGYHQLQHDMNAWIRSPKTLASAVVLGFIATYRGHARKHILGFTKRHLLTFPPLTTVPLLGSLWHFLPLISSILSRTKKK